MWQSQTFAGHLKKIDHGDNLFQTFAGHVEKIDHVYDLLDFTRLTMLVIVSNVKFGIIKKKKKMSKRESKQREKKRQKKENIYKKIQSYQNIK